MLNLWTWGKKEQRPWYGNLLWGLLYFCFCWLFFAASSPFVGARKRRRKWTLYGVGYNTLLLWVSAGLLGHSPFFLQMVEFDIDDPVSLLFPFLGRPWSSFVRGFLTLQNTTFFTLPCKSWHNFCCLCLRCHTNQISHFVCKILFRSSIE